MNKMNVMKFGSGLLLLMAIGCQDHNNLARLIIPGDLKLKTDQGPASGPAPKADTTTPTSPATPSSPAEDCKKVMDKQQKAIAASDSLSAEEKKKLIDSILVTLGGGKCPEVVKILKEKYKNDPAIDQVNLRAEQMKRLSAKDIIDMARLNNGVTLNASDVWAQATDIQVDKSNPEKVVVTGNLEYGSKVIKITSTFAPQDFKLTKPTAEEMSKLTAGQTAKFVISDKVGVAPQIATDTTTPEAAAAKTVAKTSKTKTDTSTDVGVPQGDSTATPPTPPAAPVAGNDSNPDQSGAGEQPVVAPAEPSQGTSQPAPAQGQAQSEAAPKPAAPAAGGKLNLDNSDIENLKACGADDTAKYLAPEGAKKNLEFHKLSLRGMRVPEDQEQSPEKVLGVSSENRDLVKIAEASLVSEGQACAGFWYIGKDGKKSLEFQYIPEKSLAYGPDKAPFVEASFLLFKHGENQVVNETVSTPPSGIWAKTQYYAKYYFHKAVDYPNQKHSYSRKFLVSMDADTAYWLKVRTESVANCMESKGYMANGFARDSLQAYTIFNLLEKSFSRELGSL